MNISQCNSIPGLENGICNKCSTGSHMIFLKGNGMIDRDFGGKFR